MCRATWLFHWWLFVKAIFFLTAAYAATVDPCTEAALRSAIAAGNHVTFNCDGTIVLSNTIVINRSVVLDATGHSVTLSGNRSARVFEVRPTVELTLLNLNIVDGRSPTGGVTGGGAILIDQGRLTAVGCRFERNQALGRPGFLYSPVNWAHGGRGEGGAIAATLSAVSLTNCSFFGNDVRGGPGAGCQIFGTRPPFLMCTYTGPGCGGALFASNSSVLIVGSVFETNRVHGEQFFLGAGGALYLENSLAKVSESTFLRNHSLGNGGALGQSGGNVHIDQCRFIDNSTDNSGAGVYYVGDDLVPHNGSLRLTYTLFEIGWSRGDGGGLYVIGGHTSAEACTFSYNRAANGGGAISSSASWSLFLLNSTFLGNVAGGLFSRPGGGAIFLDGPRGDVSPVIQQCTFATNAAPLGSAVFNSPGMLPLKICASIFAAITDEYLTNCIYGLVQDEGYNLSSDSSGIGIIANPRLLPLADNGGPVPTMGLALGSPALDVLSIEDPKITLADARGVPRPERRADAGAFEQTYVQIFRQPADQVAVRYQGVPYESYILQRSSGFAHWEDVQTLSANPAGVVNFDPFPVEQGQKHFLRTLLSP